MESKNVEKIEEKGYNHKKRENECERKCVCVCERERERKYVGGKSYERESVCVCVRERERERERGREIGQRILQCVNLFHFVLLKHFSSFFYPILSNFFGSTQIIN
jgi:hypothetical protein